MVKPEDKDLDLSYIEKPPPYWKDPIMYEKLLVERDMVDNDFDVYEAEKHTRPHYEPFLLLGMLAIVILGVYVLFPYMVRFLAWFIVHPLFYILPGFIVGIFFIVVKYVEFIRYRRYNLDTCIHTDKDTHSD